MLVGFHMTGLCVVRASLLLSCSQFDVVLLLTGTAWAPDDDDDDGSYGNLTPPADKSRPSVGTLQLYYSTPPTSVSVDIDL